MSADKKIYGLVAEFNDSDLLIKAAEQTQEAGYTKTDAYTPFPVHGLTEALGIKRTILPWIVLTGGILGCLGGFYLQYWVSVEAYPLNVGGRPFNSWPSFIPVTFECTILGAALSAIIGMLSLNGLPQPYHSIFNTPNFERASNDGFFLCIEEQDPKFDKKQTRRLLEDLGAVSVSEVES
ncbi:MAG: DUF3341 domain-containing protein [Kiritimatiellae bacterium]|nr:DUF3341 domain-containing protein [Kiritimatiellia bacterium]